MLELEEIEQCFLRVRSAAMEIGRENEVDSFASRASLIRQRVRIADASASELDAMLEALREDVQSFIRALQRPH